MYVTNVLHLIKSNTGHFLLEKVWWYHTKRRQMLAKMSSI